MGYMGYGPFEVGQHHLPALSAELGGRLPDALEAFVEYQHLAPFCLEPQNIRPSLRLIINEMRVEAAKEKPSW